MNIVHQLDKGDRNNLILCADFLMKHKQYFNAGEVYKKMGDLKQLAQVYVKTFQWQEAFHLASENSELREIVYMPYANWLAENDRYIEAQKGSNHGGICYSY